MRTAAPRLGAIQETIAEPTSGLGILERIQKMQWKLLVAGLVVLDSFMVYLAFQLSYGIRFYSSIQVFQLDVIPSEQMYTLLMRVLIPVWILLFAAFGLYSRQNILTGLRETALLGNATAAAVFLIMAVGFLIPALPMARGWLLVSWVAAFLFASAGRFVVRRGVQLLRKRGWFLAPAIIVGANEEARLLAEQLSRPEYSGLKILGFIDDSLPLDTPVYDHVNTIGSLEFIEYLVQTRQVEELIVATSALSQGELIGIFQKFGVSPSLNLRMSSGLYEIIATGFQVREFGSVPLVGLNRVRLTGVNQVMKLLLDYCLALPMLLVLLPIFAGIAVLIKLDSPGPVFYRRRVMGVNGRQFDAFKFRTMVVNGDELLRCHPELMEEYQKNVKLKQDPRVTRIGRILRKTSLDEFPQLFNVLRHEMSLVGPRMICPDEMALYQQAGLNLLTVKPGITGLWQVSGRSEISYQARVQLDMYYIRNWSLWMDLQLLWRTIPSVLSARGAY